MRLANYDKRIGGLLEGWNNTDNNDPGPGKTTSYDGTECPYFTLNQYQAETI